MSRPIRRTRAASLRWNELLEVVRLMNYCFNNVRIYPATHRSVIEAIEKLDRALGPLLDELDEVGIGFLHEMLYVEGVVSIEETKRNEALVELFNTCQLQYLTLAKGVSSEDLLQFFTVMAAESADPTWAPASELLARNGVRGIQALEAEVRARDRRSEGGLGGGGLFGWYERTILTLESHFKNLRSDPRADVQPVEYLADVLRVTMHARGYESFLLLPVLGRSLRSAAAHSLDVAIHACALAEILGLRSVPVQTLCLAALLHDLGHLAVDGEWDEEDASYATPSGEGATVWRRLGQGRRPAATHANWGFVLLGRNETVPAAVSRLVATHHEDLAADDPSADLLHQLLRAADAYELATSGGAGPDRGEDGEGDAVTSLPTTLRKLLLQCTGAHPMGTLVRLDDGQRAIVVRPHPTHPTRPTVYLFEAEVKEGEEVADARLLDLTELGEGGTRFRWTIERAEEPDPELDVPAILGEQKGLLLDAVL